AQPAQFVALLRRETVCALAGVNRCLLQPVPDGLRRRLELARQFFRRPAFADQLDDPLPELRWIRPMALRHRGPSFPPQRWGVHETGSTPVLVFERAYRVGKV